MFPYKNACFVSLESKRAGVDSVREKLVLGFISSSCQMGLCDGAAQLSPLRDLWPLWPDLHSDSPLQAVITAGDVTLESSCKPGVINIGSLTVSQKQPALLKLCVAQPGAAEARRGAHQIPPACTCRGQAVPLGARCPPCCCQGLQQQERDTRPGQLSAASLRSPAQAGAPCSLCFQGGAGVTRCLTCTCVSRENRGFGKTNKFAFFLPKYSRHSERKNKLTGL